MEAKEELVPRELALSLWGSRSWQTLQHLPARLGLMASAQTSHHSGTLALG